MPTRQQRSNNARGTIPRANVVRSDMGWSIAAVAGAVITLDLADDFGPLTIGGVSQMLVTPGDMLPFTMLQVGAQLLVEYATALPGVFTATLGQNDPAVRNGSGGYLTPGSRDFNQSGTIPFYENVTAPQTIAAKVTLCSGFTGGNMNMFAGFTIGEQAVVMCDLTMLGNVDLLQPSSGAVVTILPGTGYLVTWDGTFWSGAQIMP